MENKPKIDAPYKEYPICRTCLNVIRTRSYRIQENSGCGSGLKISHVLRYIVPELYLGLSHTPEICGHCRESLRVAYTFRKLCLETETMIGNYLKNVRCTAQVIDLGAVMNYLSNTKVHKAAQKILSDWEEDSPEATSANDTQTLKKIPISDYEGIKNVVKQLTSNKCPSGPVPYNMQLNPQEETPVDIDKTYPDLYNHPMIANKPNTETSKHRQKTSKTEKLKFEPSTGLYVSDSGKRFKLFGDKAILVDDTQIKQNSNVSANVKIYKSPKGDSQKEKPSLNAEQPSDIEEVSTSNKTGQVQKQGEIVDLVCKEVMGTPSTVKSSTSNPTPATKIAEESSVQLSEKPEVESSKSPKLCDVLTVCEKTGLLVNSKNEYFTADAKPIPKEKVQEEIRRALILTQSHFCEETGLLKNSKGEYFDLEGNPIDAEQVEAEKRKAKLHGENLFAISDVYTVTEDEANKSEPQAEVEEHIPASFIPKDTKKQFISVKKTSDLQAPIQEMTAKPMSNLQPLIPEMNAKPSRTTYRPVLPKLYEKTYKRTAASTNFFDKSSMPALTPIPSEGSVVLNPFVRYSSAQMVPVASENMPVIQSAPPIDKPQNILNFLINKNFRLPDVPVFRLNNSMVQTDNSEQPQHSPNLNSPMDNSSDSFASQTVVSTEQNEAIRIKDEPFDDDDLQGNKTNDSDTLSAPDVGELGQFEPWQNMLNSIEDTNEYVDVPEFVKINNVSMTDLEALRNEQLENVSGPSEASFDQTWFNETLNDKLKESETQTETTQLKMIAKRTKSALMESLPQRIPYNNKTLVKCGDYYRFEDEMSLLKSKEVAKRSKWKLIQVDNFQPSTELKTIKKVQENYLYQDNCLLYTNYTADGLYVNDHDYLLSPYVSNQIVYYDPEGKYIICRCFICGIEHRGHQHVKHMRLHNSLCKLCDIDLETPFMLNLHMKIHAKPCKRCAEVVPYFQIVSHAIIHKNEESQKTIHQEKDDSEEEELAKRGDGFKYCFVPICKNTTKNSSKIFVYVPQKKYKSWFKAVGRIRLPMKQNCFWCCEDHFDLERDCENWKQYVQAPTEVNLRIKEGTLPHLYVSCSPLWPLHKNFTQLSEHVRKLRTELRKKMSANEKENPDTENEENPEAEKEGTSEAENEEIPEVEKDESAESEVSDGSETDESVHFEVKPKRGRPIVTRLRSHLVQGEDEEEVALPIRTRRPRRNKEIEAATAEEKIADADSTELSKPADLSVDNPDSADTPNDNPECADTTKPSSDWKLVRKSKRGLHLKRLKKKSAKTPESDNEDTNEPETSPQQAEGSSNKKDEESTNDKSLANESLVTKTDDENTNTPDTSMTKTRKRRRRDVEPADEESMSTKRVLRTRGKKEEKTESPR